MFFHLPYKGYSCYFGFIKPQGIIIALNKAAVQAKRGDVGKGGIVKDEARHIGGDKIKDFAITLGLEIKGVIISYLGTEREQGVFYLLWFTLKTPICFVVAAGPHPHILL